MNSLPLRVWMFIATVLLPVYYCNAEPQPDAIYKSLTREYTLHKDGSVTLRESSLVKLMSHRAFHRTFGESFVVYNPRYQKLEIKKAETLMADGKKVSSPPNAFNEVLPSWASGSERYNGLREMVVSHTGLEVGATIAFEYVLTSQAGYYPYLMGMETASFAVPAESFRVIVRVPQGMRLNHKTLNIRLGPVVTTEKDWDVYTWNFGVVPAYPAEAFLPAGYTFLPVLSFSTSADLKEELVRLAAQPAFAMGKLPESAAYETDKIMKSQTGHVNQIAGIRSLVSQNLANLKVPLIYTGFVMDSPADVWNSMSGTEAGKALLLRDLLRYAGFRASLVASVPTPLYDPGRLNLLDIQEYLVKAEIPDSGPVYLSATAQSTQDVWPLLSGKTLVELDNPSGNVNKWEAYPENNELRMKGELGFTSAEIPGLEGNLNIYATNHFNPFFRIAANREELKPYFSTLFRKAEIKNFELNRSNLKRLEASISVYDREPLKSLGNDIYYWEIPVSPSGVAGWNSSVLPADRSVPFSLPQFVLENYEYKVILPEGWELVSPPVQIRLKEDFGNFLFSLSSEGNILEVRRTIEFVEKEVSVLKYPALRNMLMHIQLMEYKGLIFRIPQR